MSFVALAPEICIKRRFTSDTGTSQILSSNRTGQDTKILHILNINLLEFASNEKIDSVMSLWEFKGSCLDMNIPIIYIELINISYVLKMVSKRKKA